MKAIASDIERDVGKHQDACRELESARMEVVLGVLFSCNDYQTVFFDFYINTSTRLPHMGFN